MLKSISGSPSPTGINPLALGYDGSNPTFLVLAAVVIAVCVTIVAVIAAFVARNHSQTWRTASVCHGNSCVEVAPLEGAVAVRDSKDPKSPTLVYTAKEWRDFLEGAKRGEFDHLCD
jgi:hypothetical protein